MPGLALRFLFVSGSAKITVSSAVKPSSVSKPNTHRQPNQAVV
jgi:hypothetical protein